MVITHDVHRYETRPLDCWSKAKELRRDAFAALMKAKEEGRLVIGQGGELLRPIFEGLDCEVLVTEAYPANVLQEDNLARELNEAADNYGFASSLCAYPRIYYGSILLNKSPWGTFPAPDLLVGGAGGTCAAQIKREQFASEYLGIPRFTLDTLNLGCHRYDDPEYCELVKERYVAHAVSQYQELIQWLEEKSGQRFNDERFLDSMRYQKEVRVLFGKTVFLNQNIPAPLDTKSGYALMAPAIQLAGKKEVVDFYRILYDEVKWRVENQIAQLATERCRLMEDNIPPYFAMGILRYVNKWGATVIVSPYLMGVTGMECDGEHYFVPKSFEEEGIPMRTREDALRYLAEERRDGGIRQTVQRMKSVVRDWKCDGATVRNNLGCVGRIGLVETQNVFRQSGIPCITYEANQGDRRSFDEAAVKGKLEAFLEGVMGLSRLED